MFFYSFIVFSFFYVFPLLSNTNVFDHFDPLWDSDREVLMEFYKKTCSQTDWGINSLWQTAYIDHCTWEGVKCNLENRVVSLTLVNKKLQGSLPSIIGHLDKLSTLQIGKNFLYGEIPESFKELKSLQIFEVDGNRLNINSNIFENMNFLKIVNFEGNQIEEMPASFGLFVPELEYLNLKRTGLKKIPENLSNTNLKTVILSDNSHLVLDPDSGLFNLSSLQVLELDYMGLGSLPNLENLVNLSSLSLGHNRLNEVPLSIFDLKNLQTLNLNGNPLYSIEGNSFNQLKELVDLDLTGCSLNSFPNLSLPKLSRIYVSENNIPFINLTEFPRITTIRINSPSYLPESFTGFTYLIDISFQSNVPFPKGLPSSLKYFSCYGSSITQWPSDYLTANYKSLHLWQVLSQQDSLPFPDFLFNSNTTQSLYEVVLEGKIYGTLPNKFLTPSLDSLTLRNTDIEGTIPTEISMLTNLQILQFQGNYKLKGKVPTELIQLTKLQNLQIVDNELSPELDLDLEGLNRETLECTLRNSPPFSCQSQLLDTHICSVNCEGESFTGEWLMDDNICRQSLLGAKVNRSKLSIIGKEFEFITEDSLDCVSPELTYRIKGKTEIIIDQKNSSENIYVGQFIFHVSSFEIKLVSTTSRLLMQELCFGYGENMKPLEVWFPMTDTRCMESGYGYQLWFPSVSQCPSYYETFKFDSYYDTLTFSTGHLFDPLKCNPKHVSSQLSDSIMRRNYDCSSEFLSSCYPRCGDGNILGEEECDLGEVNTGTETKGCFKCSIVNGWECTHDMNLKSSNCQYVCPSNGERVENQLLCSVSHSTNNNNNNLNELITIEYILPVCIVFIFLIIIGTILLYRIKMRSQSNTNLIISENELELIELVGEGKFGKVFKGLWRGTTEVAVKVLREGKLTQEDVQTFKEEANIFMRLPPHPNLVQFLGISVATSKDEPKGENYFSMKIVTEFLSRGNLVRYFIDTLPSQTETVNVPCIPDYMLMLSLAKGIAAGMDHLHSNQIIHRDLAARNILIQSALSTETSITVIPKITDFGLSVKKKSGKLLVPVRWSPPEILRDSRCGTFKSDVWSFGIVLYEISVGCKLVPYEQIRYNKDVTNSILTGQQTIFPSSVPINYISLAKSCFSMTPSLRPSFSQLFDGIVQEERTYLETQSEVHSYNNMGLTELEFSSENIRNNFDEDEEEEDYEPQ